MIRRHFLSLLFGACLLLIRPAAAESGFFQKTIDFKGTPTKYVVYVPSGYDPAKPIPTILFLHGAGETGTDGWKQVAVGIGPAIMLNAEKWNFLVLFPQKPPAERGWTGAAQLALDILDRAKKDYNVDPSRIYLTGLSMGGAGTWAIAAEHPDMFAAIAPLCGGGRPEAAERLKTLPIWGFYGDQDGAEGIQRCKAAIEAVQAAGGNAKLTLYPGVGHNCWDKAYREEKLYDWLLQFQRK